MDKQQELVKEWLHKAEHDMEIAKLALDNKPELTDSICFHCQQAVEKYLKAYLVSVNISFKKVHSLVYLADLINDHEKFYDKFYEMVEKLEDYAVEIRYPDDWFEPTIEEAQEAFRIAHQLKDYFLNKIKS